VEIRYVYNAATAALVTWLKTGTAAPRAPMFTYDESAPTPPAITAAPPPAAAGADPAAAAAARGGRGGGGRGGPAEKPIKRDELGNALGGIRLAELAVPVAKESGELCGLGGTHVPLDAETIRRLYPTHEDYVAKVTAVTRQLVASGFLLPADAAQTVDKARRSIYGCLSSAVRCVRTSVSFPATRHRCCSPTRRPSS
jgi:hypothetical protein